MRAFLALLFRIDVYCNDNWVNFCLMYTCFLSLKSVFVYYSVHVMLGWTVLRAVNCFLIFSGGCDIAKATVDSIHVFGEGVL